MDGQFKLRILQEDVYNPQGGLGSRLGNNLKNNWGKYTAGAGLGALGVAAHHIMGGEEGEPGVLDELRTANQEGHLGNTLIDKAQGAMDHFRSDGSSGRGSYDINKADFANDGVSSASSEDAKPWKPKFDKLQDIVSGNSGSSADTHGESGPMTNEEGPVTKQLTPQELQARADYATRFKSQFQPEDFDEKINDQGQYTDDNNLNEKLYQKKEQPWYKFGQDEIITKQETATPEDIAKYQKQYQEDYKGYQQKLAQNTVDNVRDFFDRHGSAAELQELPERERAIALKWIGGDESALTTPEPVKSDYSIPYINKVISQGMSDVTDPTIQNATDFIDSQGINILKSNDYMNHLKYLSALKGQGQLPPQLEGYFEKLSNEYRTNPAQFAMPKN